MLVRLVKRYSVMDGNPPKYVAKMRARGPDRPPVAPAGNMGPAATAAPQDAMRIQGRGI